MDPSKENWRFGSPASSIFFHTLQFPRGQNLEKRSSNENACYAGWLWLKTYSFTTMEFRFISRKKNNALKMTSGETLEDKACQFF